MNHPQESNLNVCLRIVLMGVLSLAAVLSVASCGRDSEEKKHPDHATEESNQQMGKEEKKVYAEEQRRLATFAAHRLREISFSPNVHLSNSLKAQHVTVQIVGEGLQEIKSAIQHEDWLAALAILLDKEEMREYPNEREINEAANRLWHREFWLLLKPMVTVPERRALYYITLVGYGNPSVDYYFSPEVVRYWYPHPDNTAWYHSWAPEHREILVFVGEYSTMIDPLHEIVDAHAEYRKSFENLRAKKKLGELSEDEYAEQCRRLSDKQHGVYMNLLTRY